MSLIKLWTRFQTAQCHSVTVVMAEGHCKNPPKQTWLLPPEMVKEPEPPSFLSDLHAAPAAHCTLPDAHLSNSPASLSLDPPSVPFLGHSWQGTSYHPQEGPFLCGFITSKQNKCHVTVAVTSTPSKSTFRPVCAGFQLRMFFLSNFGNTDTDVHQNTLAAPSTKAFL